MHPVEYRLPAEWEPQDAILLAWPFAGSDWTDDLERVAAEYVQIVDAVLGHQSVLLLVPPGDRTAADRLGERSGLELVPVRYNDTWCRDYGPLVLCNAGRRLALDFHFNGWGGKYEARLDNRVNAHLATLPRFSEFDFRQSLFEIEGGAVDTDGRGTLLINRHCLRTRHPYLDDAEVDAELGAWFNTVGIIEIDMPPMPGDDTDGHIDTLARFAAPDRIVFQEQREPDATRRLLGQLEEIRSPGGAPYDLISMPAPVDVDPALPASYVNFLLCNGGVVMPRFGSRFDDRAARIAAELFPERDIHPVDALALAGQGGGPHCATMQIPAALA